MLPRAADVYGRKPIFILGLVLYIFAVVGMMVGTSLGVLKWWLFVAGIAETGRYYVAYVYAIEIFTRAN